MCDVISHHFIASGHLFDNNMVPVDAAPDHAAVPSEYNSVNVLSELTDFIGFVCVCVRAYAD